MPKTKVRKSRTRKSGMRKSLRIKRGGTRDKSNRTESKAAKSEHKPIQKSMSRSNRSPPPTPPSDIEAMTMTNSELNAIIKKTQSKPPPFPNMGLGNMKSEDLRQRDRKHDNSNMVLSDSEIKKWYKDDSDLYKEYKVKEAKAIAIRNEARRKRDEARRKRDEETTAQNDTVASDTL